MLTYEQDVLPEFVYAVCTQKREKIEMDNTQRLCVLWFYIAHGTNLKGQSRISFMRMILHIKRLLIYFQCIFVFINDVAVRIYDTRIQY